MTFTISAVVLALAATSQVTAIVSIPVKECTQSYVVEPGTPHCDAFAAKFGVTFLDLLKWNQKLRPDCLNLDIGYPICVSVTPGKCCLNENPKGVYVPQEGKPEQPNMWDPTPYTKTPVGTLPTSTSVAPPVMAPTNGTATPVAPTGSPTTTSSNGNTTNGGSESSRGSSSNSAAIGGGVAGVVVVVATLAFLITRRRRQCKKPLNGTKDSETTRQSKVPGAMDQLSQDKITEQDPNKDLRTASAHEPKILPILGQAGPTSPQGTITTWSPTIAYSSASLIPPRPTRVISRTNPQDHSQQHQHQHQHPITQEQQPSTHSNNSPQCDPTVAWTMSSSSTRSPQAAEEPMHATSTQDLEEQINLMQAE
ncbi:hypothetical protein BGZ93_003816, partial [Podila epicladia]